MFVSRINMFLCVFVVLLAFFSASEGTAQFTISPSTVKTGDRVVFKCEDSNFGSQTYSFYGVNLYKGTTDDNNKVASVSVGSNDAGQVTVRKDVNHREYMNIAQIDGNFATSTRKGFLELTVNAIPCSNSDGTQVQWICVIKSNGDDMQNTQTLSITAIPGKFTITNTPRPTYEEGVTGYKVGTVVTFRCSGNLGVPQKTLRWELVQYKNNPQMPQQLTGDDVSFITPAPGNNQQQKCTNTGTTTLRYNVTADDRYGSVIICRTESVANVPLNQTRTEYNLTVIGYEDGNPGGSTGGDGGETSNAGVIAGAVIGALAFIIIIVLIIVFVIFKRKGRGETYKTRETDEDPDQNGPDVYAQPIKNKKDKNGVVNPTMNEPEEKPYTIADKYYQNQSGHYGGDDGYGDDRYGDKHRYDDRYGRSNDGLEDDNTDVPKKPPSTSGSVGSAV